MRDAALMPALSYGVGRTLERAVGSRLLLDISKIITANMKRPICVALIATVGVSGCADMQGGQTNGASSGSANHASNGFAQFIQTHFDNADPCSDNARNIGGVGGAVVGTAIGVAVSRNKLIGGLIGAAIGAATGGLVGHAFDARRCALSKIAKANNLDMTVSPVAVADGDSHAQPVGLSVSIKDMPRNMEFRSGSDTLTPEAQRYFGEIAEQYRPQTRLASASTPQERAAVASTRILLIGHTDDTGDSQHNADLSERRARAVAKLFAAKGVPADSVFYQGAGETLPIADNRTEEGRASNRRVEIVDLTDVKSDILSNYLSSRTPNYQYYRPVDRTAQADAHVAADSGAHETPRAGSRRAKGRATGKAAAVADANSRSAGVRTDTDNASAAAAAATSASVATNSANATNAVSPSAAGTNTTAKTAGAGSAQTPAAALASATPSKPTATASAFATAAAPATGGVAAPLSVKAGEVDFGWHEAAPASLGVNFGSVTQQKSALSIFSDAKADDAPVSRTCANDRVRVANSVKSVSNDADLNLKTSQYYPGLYDTSWAQTVNGHLVALKNVAVLRDGAAPVHNPELVVYQDYTPAQAQSARPSFQLHPRVNAYPVSQGVLYRVFVDNGKLFNCMDIVFPKTAPFVASQGQLVRAQQGKYYAADFRPAIAR
ncbi:OmpA family protein [Paraburkholderia susongensis]|uniref:Outer membrane protein OmpA n=1 Tax=Paraburkholderia susongensis TaxID=1515439 RepID=A0A1X7ID01_9BURK|nr:OmpA family protein [Paraburkholderia susongensis]SMG12502.1 Outer membrane protein OmpA [Paraburkholderia susongensis]